MDNPQVSVIVPNYNHERFLRRRIDTILNQTFQDFELILLDDCSTDNSRSVLESYQNHPAVRFAFNETNSGSTFKQWNKGVKLARGQFIWLAESDDYADEHLLERLVPKLQNDSRVTFAFCRSWMVTADETRIEYADAHLSFIDPRRWTADYSADGAEECRRFFMHRNIIPNASAVVFRKSIYDQMGGAPEDMRLAGDWKLWAAMALQGRIEYVAEPMNFFRCHNASARIRLNRLGNGAAESLAVTNWIASQTNIADRDWPEIRKSLSTIWLDAVASPRVPADLRRQVMQTARKLDPAANILVLQRILSNFFTIPWGLMHATYKKVRRLVFNPPIRKSV